MEIEKILTEEFREKTRDLAKETIADIIEGNEDKKGNIDSFPTRLEKVMGISPDSIKAEFTGIRKVRVWIPIELEF